MCSQCGGDQWVCEQHEGRWFIYSGEDKRGCPIEDCSGSGMPCPTCQPLACDLMV